MNLEMSLNRVSLVNQCEDPKLTRRGVGNTTGGNASRVPPETQALPIVPAINSGLNGTDTPRNTGEKSDSKRGRVGAGEKETRGRTAIRDEVAERLRLRTNPQAVGRDSPTDDNDSEDPALITNSKRKKPTPPTTM
jgi:hypothetical protein